MYEVVKKYETYVAHNKRLDGKGTGSSVSQPKTTGHTSSYKPRFHKTTAFAAAVEESEGGNHHPQESSPMEEADSSGTESSQEDDEGLYIPGYLEEAVPDDPVLQLKMARAMRALEKETRRCYKCDKPGHLQKDCDEVNEKMGKGPSSQRGLPKTSQLRRGQRSNPLSQVEPHLKQILQSKESSIFEPRCFL